MGSISMMNSTTRGPWHFGGMWRCIGRCCWGVGGRVMNNMLTGSGIWGDTAVRQAVLLGERRPCDGQDTVEVVGREGDATDDVGVVGRSIY